MARNLTSWVVGFTLVGVTLSAGAQDFAFSAKVDKTAADVGDPVTLTLTLSGDLSQVTFPAITLPEGLAVAAQSQATNFSIRTGAMERATSLVYVLIPQHAGTFQLGPFSVERQKQTLKTEPITLTVKQSALPPRLRQQPQGERFTL